MVTVAPPTFRPRSDFLHVRLLTPAEQSSGGVLLPETARRNAEEAQVLAVGPGRPLPLWVANESVWPANPTLRATVWADVEDRVLFRKHNFHPLTPDSREGVVRDEALLAIIDPATGEIAMPCGEWCLIALAEWETERSGIAIPELDQHRPPWGRVKAWGPGRWVEEGFRRISVAEILDVEEESLTGLMVTWTRHSEEVFEVGREAVSGILVKASELLAYKES